MFDFFKNQTAENDKLKKLIATLNTKVRYIYSANDLSGTAEYDDLKKLSFEEQKTLVNQLTFIIVAFSLKRATADDRHTYSSNDIEYYGTSIAFSIQTGVLRRKLNYTETEWIEMFKGFRLAVEKLSAFESFHFHFHQFPINYAIKQIEYYLKKNKPSAELTAFIEEMLKWKEFDVTENRYYSGSDMTKAAKKLKSLLLKEGTVPTFRLKAEDIGEDVHQVIDSIAKNKTIFEQIFHIASNASNAKPPKKFIDEVTKHQNEIGLDVFRKTAHQILQIPMKHKPIEKTTTYQYNRGSYDYTETTYLCQPNQQFIKGMVWTMNRFSDKETIHILSKLCEKSYTKIAGKGPAAASIGNACVYILGNMRGKDGLGALSRLKLKVRQNNVKKTIDKHLLEGAKKYNVSVEELKEMAVPEFRLEQGKKTIIFDDYELQVSIEGRKVAQQWIKPDGKPMKSVPSAVKKSTALTNKLKAVRKEVKDIQKVYSAQKARIDNQFILDRSWNFGDFQKYYLNHGVVSPIAKKLIWTFTKGDKTTNAIFVDEKWYNEKNELIDWIDTETNVKLFHPVNADEATIIAWREKMIELEWKQPIKQAFREIYILTDAEINTRTYSNRMAAHILKQHQFSSLANLRGWKYSLMGAFDDGINSQICKKHLPEYNMTAEYWIDEMYQDDAFNDTGIWLYIATDQVKFKDENGEVIEMVNVPKMVFTEIMRDVDMFVGVCSVGNDPQWMDNNGDRQTNRDYWTSYSFGDLTEIAKTRKTILQRLLPRLKKIRDKAHIDGKFLVVKGTLRTYKIHIGSGNILMEPNDQYLCIVPARSAENATQKVFIPFEGDKGLSIVLSKAFLLVADNKITDSTITSQINR
ncbi:MAG: DUF4132 domain-containing protein [Chitinophagales bacterium]